MEHCTPEKILDHFVIEQKTYGIEPLVQGYINETFRIMDKGVPVFLLQRINRDVFPDIPGLMENLQTILPLLKEEDYHPVSFMYTKSRQPYYRDETGHYWRLMTFVSNGVSYDFSTSPEIAFEAGRVLGRFHSLLENVDPGNIREILPGFHDLEKRKHQFGLALSNASAKRRDKAGEEIGFAREVLGELGKNTPAQLPIRICHNDTKLNNFLFSSKTGKGLCLIDLDTVMPGFLHFDIGDAIRTLANPCPEDEKNLEKITFDLEMADAFLRGIRASELKLSQGEIQAVYYGAVLMPFLHGLRALTDFLENDRYYRVSYPEQNLNRSRSLFAVVRKTRENKNALSALVQKVLGN